MLSKIEIYKLVHNYIGVEGGYLIGFSYKIHEEFYPIYCDLLINPNEYSGTTKEKFVEILQSVSPNEQIKILKGIFKKLPIETFLEESRIEKLKIYENYQKIIKRLEVESVKPSKQEIEAHFEEIQKQILLELDKAKHIIWIAVSWFTDEKIFKKLAHRRYEGLTVEIILLDDKINKKSGLNYEKYLKVYWSKNKAKMMHNKFCIIDLKTCITGSYNWTNKAAYRNYENVTIKKNTDTISDYASEFIKIRKEVSGTEVK